MAEHFPNCVTETAEGIKIDFDLLQQELSADIIEGNKERYRLEWPGKREAIVTANLPTTKTLRPVREDSVDFDNTENLYIEGDNLEVLKLLQESYLGKIKMIYIDPPYNTGKDFVYKDNFSKDTQEELIESGQKDEYNQRLVVNPETAGRYHSDWLSMMYPRLKLARNLLTQDGAIFISIDDNEQHNLRRLCDDIFGEHNKLGVIANINNPKGRSDDKFIAT
ncbi:MAG: site-specific DNA-methyltransferase, partial [Bacteroidetes bacterium]|nr:site-specific DNA-methyltransferase [Bacteroidota bacterium]